MFYLCVSQDKEVLHAWLHDLHFEDYYSLFVQAGYDMPTISRMTPEVPCLVICPLVFIFIFYQELYSFVSQPMCLFLCLRPALPLPVSKMNLIYKCVYAGN